MKKILPVFAFLLSSPMFGVDATTIEKALEGSTRQIQAGLTATAKTNDAVAAPTDASDRMDALEEKINGLSALVGKVKTSWKLSAYYRDSAGSPLSPTAWGDDLFMSATLSVEKYFEKNFQGNASIRLTKRVGDEDLADVDLLIARFNYSLPWVRISLGRQDYGPQETSAEFFGSFITAGLHRLDMVSVTVPLAFTTDIDDRGGFKSPPTAIMYGYVPRLLSVYQTAVPTDMNTSGLHLAQFRIAVPIEGWGVENTLKLNGAYSPSAVITTSPLSGDPAFSAVYDLTILRSYSLFGEYGMQNTAMPSTGAFVLGAKVRDMQTKIWVLDEAVFEMLIPGSEDPMNVLTGGSVLANGAGAEAPTTAWYFRLSNSIGKWDLGFSMTNAWGDYTFGRIRQGTMTVPLDAPLADFNEIDGQAVTLRANSVLPLANHVYSNYHF